MYEAKSVKAQFLKHTPLDLNSNSKILIEKKYTLRVIQECVVGWKQGSKD